MRSIRITAMFGLMAVSALALADDSSVQRFTTVLTAVQEVPVVSSAAKGRLTMLVDESAGTINYELSYENLEGTISQAHVHFGVAGTAGGISMWLCGTTTNPGPTGTPVCATSPTGSVSGVLMSAQVVGPAGQGIAVGRFARVVQAIRRGQTYGNVHTTHAPGGEIRGQLRRGNGNDRHDHD